MSFADKFQPKPPFHERCGWDQVKYAPGSWAAEEHAWLKKMGQKPKPPAILTAPSWFDHAEALESILLAPDSIMTPLKKSLSFNEQLDELITYYPAFLPKDIQDNLKSLKISISKAGNIKNSHHQHEGRPRIDSTTSEAIQSAAMLTAYCYVAENVMPIIIGEKLKDRDPAHQGYPYPDYGRIIKTCMYPILTKKSVREQCMQPVLERMQALPLPDNKMRDLQSLIEAFPDGKNMHDVSTFVDREIMPEIRGQYSLQLNGERAHPMIADHRSGGIS